MKILPFLLLSFLVFSCGKHANEPIRYTIAFGSCAHQDADNHLWNEVVSHEPALWIWLGDNIYGDSEDPVVLKAKYDKQKQNSGYQVLLKTVPVIGVWDDHDYGVNDGGKEYPLKEESKALMLDFLDVPADADVRYREGAYQSYVYNAAGKKIKVILLDTRCFRDTLFADTVLHKCVANPEGDVLGEPQWLWLEKELDGNADINILASSIQVIPEEHNYEKWSNFPKARKRLLDLIERKAPKGLIIISGDRHIAEFSKMKLEKTDLHEFTSSGITSTWGTARDEQNRHRVGKMMIARNFGIMNFRFSDDKTEVLLQAYGENNQLLGEQKVVFSEKRKGSASAHTL